AGPTIPLHSSIAAGLIASLRPRNLVLPPLLPAGVLGVLAAGFVTVAPNRLLSGRPVGLFAAADGRLSAAITIIAAFLLLTALAPPARAVQRTAALLAAGFLLLVLAASGEAAASLAAGAPTLAR